MLVMLVVLGGKHSYGRSVFVGDKSNAISDFGVRLDFFLVLARCGFKVVMMHRRTLNIAVLLLVGSFVLTSVYLAREQLQLQLPRPSLLRQEQNLQLKAVEVPAKALQVIQDGESFHAVEKN